MDIREYGYVIIDIYENDGVFFKLLGNREAFWCRLLYHDPVDGVCILKVDQHLINPHPFINGDLIMVDDDFEL